jgi:dihydropteroate synthase
MAPFDLTFGDRIIHLSGRTHVMGILNVTPDSFYDGGRYSDAESAALRGISMVGEGADFLDVGGESTRPGADPVPAEVELSRVIPVIESLNGRVDVPISIDTRKADVAEAAIRAGADWINDVGGLRDDPAMISVAARLKVPVVIMHKRGSTRDMQADTRYADVVGDIKSFFESVLRDARDRGIAPDRVVLDPGIGFGKSAEDNFLLLRRLPEFLDFGLPVMVGVSRKSFIGKTLGLREQDRLAGTVAAVAVSAFLGANIVRVHDVIEAVHAVRIADRIRRTGGDA